jgi:hypothetical protein
MRGKQGRTPKTAPRYCPRCRLEQPDDLERRICPECGDALIPQGYCPVCEGHLLLPIGALCPKHDIVLEATPPGSVEAITPDEHIAWVTVTLLPNTLAAAVPRTRLEAEGIPTFVEGERMGSLGVYNVATRGVKLQVPAKWAAEARIILSQNWSLPVDETADFEDLV